MVTQVKASVAWGRVLKVYELQGPLQVDLRGVMDVNMGLLQHKDVAGQQVVVGEHHRGGAAGAHALQLVHLCGHAIQVYLLKRLLFGAVFKGQGPGHAQPAVNGVKQQGFVAPLAAHRHVYFMQLPEPLCNTRNEKGAGHILRGQRVSIHELLYTTIAKHSYNLSPEPSTIQVQQHLQLLLTIDEQFGFVAEHLDCHGPEPLLISVIAGSNEPWRRDFDQQV
mmetsp:Transcript_13708/g.37022  ORF Transcript_13708/g.37022 Transcript_13708/m.37022 type:complete len:222 (+) Transcript_13708:990-1655(+)|eukprot:CAMPEP_0202382006 /NCGR_PEP_ID=MMETSP1127-20130417/40388_1 /ASSEMBLY_ACC=CAM_ASM_000462 /TAXON_ID=3047 /ORGANISM="Dunaliella tertiolecta, Strain CCMP1320" /LENGTH=221 /DNA_ID=CAMNT_0048981103 /DNA_START=897 /DNA_END=1562 /DNA_ORIENTATION=+